MNDAVIVVCSRPDSRRLPRKCFFKLGDYRAITILLSRLQGCDLPVILALPDNLSVADMTEYESCRPFGVKTFAGSPGSPLHRIHDLLKEHPEYKYVVRVTHDDILIDQESLIGAVDLARNGGFGYVYMPDIIDGMGVEVIAAENILHAAQNTDIDIEHISYVVRGPGMPNPSMAIYPVREELRKRFRLTMDDGRDAAVLRALINHCGCYAQCGDYAAHLSNNPSLTAYNKKPLVTVYTVARNMSEYIHLTMDSVQSLWNRCEIEYILVDDASTDDTLEMMLKFAAARPRVQVIANDTNIGLAASCNKVLKSAQGDYMLRVDGDDLISSGSVEQMLKIARAQRASAVYASYNEIDKDGKVLAVKPPQENHHAGCALMDRRLLQEIGFRDGLRNWDSLDIFLKLMKYRGQVAYTDQVLWKYRRRDGSVSAAMTPQRGEDLVKVLEQS